MADRFPSLEEFDSDAQIEPKGDATFDLDFASPTVGDDFLSREKQVLGDDASLFASGNDSAAFETGNNDDLLGSSSGGQTGGEQITEFESSFPEISTQNENVAPGGTLTSNSQYQAYASYEEEAEPPVITEWRERRDAALATRAEKSERKKTETIKAAQQSIDDFYENYNSKKEKMIAQTRREAEEFLASRQDTSSGGTSWERIAKLVDLSGKGAKGGASGMGKERFRELLISLKKDEKAPGAAGY